MLTLLEQVIEAAKTLPDEQLKEVSSFIKSLKSQNIHKNPLPPSSKQLLEIMLHKGLIEELPDLESEAEPELAPIFYIGKPFSETIIEDRGSK